MFVTNWISTTKIQKISEITNFFRHYFLSRTEVIYGQNIQRKNGEKEEKKFKIEIVEEVRTMPAIMEEKARVPKKPVLRKPYITPGFGPLALKYGSIVMGKSLKTGLVAYNEEKF